MLQNVPKLFPQILVSIKDPDVNIVGFSVYTTQNMKMRIEDNNHHSTIPAAKMNQKLVLKRMSMEDSVLLRSN